MKRYIRSEKNVQNSNKVDFIVIVNDARTFKPYQMPIVASSNMSEDYDNYSGEELMDLDFTVLRKIKTPYALDELQTAINKKKQEYIDKQIPREKQDRLYALTAEQRTILKEFYRRRENSEIPKYDVNVQDLLADIKSCNIIYGPTIRNDQPEKNFAEVHNIPMQSIDYLSIIHDIEPNEFIGALKSANDHRLGIVLYEFIHNVKNYKLKSFDFTIDGPIDIYIKLIPNYNEKYKVTVISFHDPLDSTFDADL